MTTHLESYMTGYRFPSLGRAKYFDRESQSCPAYSDSRRPISMALHCRLCEDQCRRF